jgi:carbohydrate diacid regulator
VPSRVTLPAAPSSLTPELAQQIAGETSAIVGFNILITNTEGVVIGSGDTERVGSFHEASLDVVHTRRPATHTATQARALQGVLPGVTLPIMLNGQAVGTVGITGVPAQVTRFGLMVERQTEILLQESLLVRSRLLRERVLEELVRDIATFDPESVGAELIVDRAREQNLDLSVKRVAVVVDVSRRARGVGVEGAMLPSALRLLRDCFAHPQSIAVGGAADRYVVLARIGRSGRDEAVSLSQQCVQQFRQRLGSHVAIGVGSIAVGLASLRTSYEDAVDAVRLGASNSADGVAVVDTIRVPQLVAGVGRRARERYTAAVAGNLRDQADWQVLRDTVISWCESGFSLVHAAVQLQIHRNTLVYRLEKIEGLQGLPDRSGRSYLALYLACVADRLDDRAENRSETGRPANSPSRVKKHPR